MDLKVLEENIGYKFNNIELLKTALTHKSYANENNVVSYERLEFLGDSILEFISSKILYKEYKNLSEGEMTKVRAYSVCEDSLFEIATEHNFSDFLYLGKSEKTSKNNKKAILADTVEAIIAAIYMDSNIGNAEIFIENNIRKMINRAIENGFKDYKTILQEKLQVNGDVLIQYIVIKESGPDHDKMFTVELQCDGKKLTQGEGHSKKAAEMEAARKALEQF